MKAIVEAGLRIPDSIAIVDCGNVRYDPALRVSLTSVDQESESLGDQAANLAVDLV